MKKPSLLILFIFYSLVIFAKAELPPYGEIDKADLRLKTCEFDRGAEAYELMSSGDVYYKVIDGDFNIVTERRLRIKILTEKGIEKSKIQIRFFSMENYETVKDVSGITYNLDSAGNIVTSQLDKGTITVKKIDNQVSEMSFALPSVKVGSVIEYRFTKNRKSISNIDDWYFQDDIPTRISVYRIAIPAMFIFNSKVFAYQDIEQERDVINEEAVYRKKHMQFASQLKTYTLENVSGLKKEPFMGASKDYLQRVAFQLSGIKFGNGDREEISATWEQLSAGILNNEAFGGQITKNISNTKNLDESLANTQGDYNKMAAVYDYVRKKIAWNGERGIYPSFGVRQAWDKKKGNEADLNFILINLLRNQGIAAYPLLVSTKDNGTVNVQYPFLQQFNTTMACVVIEDKKYILNAADKYNEAYLVPSNVLNNDAFVVDNSKGGWIVLSSDNALLQNDVSLDIQINPMDSLTGKAVIKSYNYAKNQKLKIWEKDTSSFINYYRAPDSLLQIKNIKVEGADVDSAALTQKFDFAMLMNSKKDHDSFSVNLFQGLKDNPFVSDERKTDINFNYRQSYTIEGKIAIPEDYVFGLSKNSELMMPDSSIILEKYFYADNSNLNFKINLDFKKTYYDVKDYPQLEEFYKKLYTALNEKIAIKKKRNVR